jgi:hypothetical protein
MVVESFVDRRLRGREEEEKSITTIRNKKERK